MRSSLTILIIFCSTLAFARGFDESMAADARNQIQGYTAIAPAGNCTASLSTSRTNQRTLEDRLRALESIEASALGSSYTDSTRSAYESHLQTVRRQKDQVFNQLRQWQLCAFRQGLRAEIQRIGQGENAQWLRQLNEVGECLGNRPAGSILDQFGSFFRNLFNHFWNKPSLSNEDCRVLQQAYRVWSSLYEDRNQGEARSNIPVYNVNAHNASFYYWAQEQRNGRIPPEGLTVFHADTHSDVAHVHSHANHWTNGALDMRTAQQATLQSNQELPRFVAREIERSNLAPEQRAQMLRRVSQTPPAQLRAELSQAIRQNVHQIAQPLTAAQLTGVSNGRYVMCMPPWSREFPRSRYVRDAQGRSRPQGLEFELREMNRLQTGGGLTLAEARPSTIGYTYPCSRVNERIPSVRCYPDSERDRQGRLIGTANYQVVDCNNEELVEIGSDSAGRVQYDVRDRSGQDLFPFEDFMTDRDREQGFLLDIDLDVFVSEGRGNSVEPTSYLRPNHPDRKDPDHANANELNPRTDVPSRELEQIKDRIDGFFDRLEQAKNQGYLPKVITIADSTNLERALRSRESNDLNGGNFTPACLSFVVNYMVRERLSSLYGTTPP